MNKCISTTLILTLLIIFAFSQVWANPLIGPESTSYLSYLIPISIIGMSSLIAYSLISYYSKPSPVEFSREDVSIYIFEDYVQVEGTYTFRNPSLEPEKVKTTYPLIIDDQIGEPYSISLLDDTGDEIPYREVDRGIQFEYEMPPGEHKDIHITYKQPYTSNEYTYILTSTQTWGKPLQVARFTVNTAGSLGELNSNYPFSKVSEKELFSQYFYQTQDFYPDRELELSWE